MRLNPSTAPKQAGPICFRCSKSGHLSHDCKLGKPHAVAAHVAEDEEAIPDEDGPEGEDQEEEALVDGVEQEDALLEGNQYLNKLVEDDGTCYDLIRLGLRPVPEPCPARSDPRVFQPRRVAQCNASCDLAPMHTSTCLHVLTHECAAPEGPCTSPAYVPCSQSSI